MIGEGGDVGRRLTGLRVGVFGRGGAGKSTAVVLLAHALRRRGYEVAVLDADSTNLGLADALGARRAPCALIEHFGGMVFSGGKVTCPVDDPSLLDGCEVLIETLPEGYVARNRSGIALLSAGKIGRRGPGAGCDGPMAKIARDIRLRSRAGDPVTLIDFKAGLEDSARGVITGLDWAFVVVDASTAGLAVASSMNDLVERIHEGEKPAVAHLGAEEQEFARHLYRDSPLRGAIYVLSKVPDASTRHTLESRLHPIGIEIAGAIPRDSAVARCWLNGAPLDPEPTREDLDEIVAALERAETHATHVGAELVPPLGRDSGRASSATTGAAGLRRH